MIMKLARISLAEQLELIALGDFTFREVFSHAMSDPCVVPKDREAMLRCLHGEHKVLDLLRMRDLAFRIYEDIGSSRQKTDRIELAEALENILQSLKEEWRGPRELEANVIQRIVQDRLGTSEDVTAAERVINSPPRSFPYLLAIPVLDDLYRRIYIDELPDHLKQLYHEFRMVRLFEMVVVRKISPQSSLKTAVIEHVASHLDLTDDQAEFLRMQKLGKFIKQSEYPKMLAILNQLRESAIAMRNGLLQYENTADIEYEDPDIPPRAERPGRAP